MPDPLKEGHVAWAGARTRLEDINIFVETSPATAPSHVTTSRRCGRGGKTSGRVTAREDEMQEEKRQDGQVQRNVVVDVVLD